MIIWEDLFAVFLILLFLYCSRLLSARSSVNEHDLHKLSRGWYVRVKNKRLYKYLTCNGYVSSSRYIPKEGDEDKILVVGVFLYVLRVLTIIIMIFGVIDFEVTSNFLKNFYSFFTIPADALEFSGFPYASDSVNRASALVILNWPIYFFMMIVSLLDDFLGYIVYKFKKITEKS